MKRAPRNPGVAYGRALDTLQTAERRLSRAFNAWNKARLALARADRRLNKAEASGNC